MVTTGRILDLLADAVQRYKMEGHRGTFRSMTAEERRAFDAFLVMTGDPLAWRAGTTESRFRARVQAMVEKCATDSRGETLIPVVAQHHGAATCSWCGTAPAPRRPLRAVRLESDRGLFWS